MMQELKKTTGRTNEFEKVEIRMPGEGNKLYRNFVEIRFPVAVVTLNAMANFECGKRVARECSYELL
jgi:hypothetical protein